MANITVPDWLGTLLFGVRRVFANGVELDASDSIDVKSPLAASFNATTGRIDLTNDTTGGPSVQTLAAETVPLLASPIIVPEGQVVGVRAVIKGTFYAGGSAAPFTQIAPYAQSVLGIYDTANGVTIAEEAIVTASVTLIDSPPFGGSIPTVGVTGAANVGGFVQLTVDTTTGMSANPIVSIANVGGTTEANGIQQAAVVDGTHINLPRVPFVHAYTSGGTVTTLGSAGLMLSGNAVQIAATGIRAPAYGNSAAAPQFMLMSANGNVYVVRRGGGGTTSASGTGPSGTGTNIVDGSAHFDYVCPGTGVPLTWRVASLEIL